MRRRINWFFFQLYETGIILAKSIILVMVFSIDLFDASIDGNFEINSSRQSTLLFKRSNSADVNFLRTENSLS